MNGRSQRLWRPRIVRAGADRPPQEIVLATTCTPSEYLREGPCSSWADHDWTGSFYPINAHEEGGVRFCLVWELGVCLQGWGRTKFRTPSIDRVSCQGKKVWPPLAGT